MLARLTSAFVRGFDRWMPDSFVIALFLSLLTFILSVSLTDATATETVAAWGDGFWDLLTFTNQIVLTLIFGYALAYTPAINRLLRRVASLPTSPTTAYLLVTLTSTITALFSWGLSLIAGAIVARFTGEECRRLGIAVHYPLLVACGFVGFVVWHQGLSSSIGLAIATPGHFLESELGLIALSETLFTTWNFLLALLVLLTLPLLMARLHPGPAEQTEIPDAVADSDPTLAGAELPRPNSPATYLEQARPLNWVIVVAGGCYLAIEMVVRGKGLNLNLLNFAFLMLGLLLARSPIHYVHLIVDAVRVAAPFLLQYPFYAGIAGMMATTGLAQLAVNALVAVGGVDYLPLWSFVSAAILNIFIPSGGGQWAIQGPIVVQAALETGASLPHTIMAVMLGDQWTNLIHPLVLVPVAAIAGLQVRQLLGYCATALIFTGAVFFGALLLY